MLFTHFGLSGPLVLSASAHANWAKDTYTAVIDLKPALDETRRYLTCDLLILDDLGSELTTQFVQSALYELLNTRLVANRHTVISSNLTMEEATRRYSPQIASRLIGEYHVLHFFGDDIRLLKKNKL